MEIIEILNWFFILFAVAGMQYVSGSKNNLLRANILYTIANIWSIFYFFYSRQWPYLLLYSVFMFMSVRGVILNFLYRKEIKI